MSLGLDSGNVTVRDAIMGELGDVKHCRQGAMTVFLLTKYDFFKSSQNLELISQWELYTVLYDSSGRADCSQGWLKSTRKTQALAEQCRLLLRSGSLHCPSGPPSSPFCVPFPFCSLSAPSPTFASLSLLHLSVHPPLSATKFRPTFQGTCREAPTGRAQPGV